MAFTSLGAPLPCFSDSWVNSTAARKPELKIVLFKREWDYNGTLQLPHGCRKRVSGEHCACAANNGPTAKALTDSAL